MTTMAMLPVNTMMNGTKSPSIASIQYHILLVVYLILALILLLLLLILFISSFCCLSFLVLLVFVFILLLVLLSFLSFLLFRSFFLLHHPMRANEVGVRRLHSVFHSMYTSSF